MFVKYNMPSPDSTHQQRDGGGTPCSNKNKEHIKQLLIIDNLGRTSPVWWVFDKVHSGRGSYDGGVLAGTTHRKRAHKDGTCAAQLQWWGKQDRWDAPGAPLHPLGSIPPVITTWTNHSWSLNTLVEIYYFSYEETLIINRTSIDIQNWWYVTKRIPFRCFMWRWIESFSKVSR